MRIRVSTCINTGQALSAIKRDPEELQFFTLENALYVRAFYGARRIVLRRVSCEEIAKIFVISLVTTFSISLYSSLFESSLYLEKLYFAVCFSGFSSMTLKIVS